MRLSDHQMQSMLAHLSAVVSAAGILAGGDDFARAVAVSFSIKDKVAADIEAAESHEDFRRLFIKVFRLVLADLEGREAAKVN